MLTGTKEIHIHWLGSEANYAKDIIAIWMIDGRQLITQVTQFDELIRVTSPWTYRNNQGLAENHLYVLIPYVGSYKRYLSRATDYIRRENKLEAKILLQQNL